MHITDIRKRRKRLSALYLDGEFAVEIDTEILQRSGFQVGSEIRDEQLHALFLESEQHRANEKALYLLERRNHSKKELAEKIQRQSTRAAAQAAVERMETLGLVNDEDYAQRYAADLLCRKGYGRRRVQYELQQKGIDKEIAERVIAELEPDPVGKITELIERKYARHLQDEKGFRRVVNGLQRYGYRYEDIRRAMAAFTEVLAEEDSI